MKVVTTLGVMEVIKVLLVDAVVLSIFGIAAYRGYYQSYRISLTHLLIQLTTISLSFLTAWELVHQLIGYIPKSMSLSLFIPDSFYYLVEPYESYLIPLIIFCLLFIIFFIIIKSILYVFSVNYEWHQYVFKTVKFDRLPDQCFSLFLSVLNMYTYMIVVLIIIAFPLFNLTKPYSISSLLLKVNPVISSLVSDFYKPYRQLQENILYFEDDFDLIFYNNQLDFDQLEIFMKKHPNEEEKVHDAFNDLIPFIATTSGFLSFFPDNKISEQEMKDYLTHIKSYIEKDVVTLENFNFYYKELIQNGTYDRLVEDEVISDKALQTLINSGMLNDVNLKNKEY